MVPSADSLDILGVAPAAARIIRYFLIRPEACPHLREIQRALELGGASIQRELERLVLLGALQRRPEGRLVRYRVSGGSPVWTAMRILESTSRDPAPLLRDALVDVPGITVALLFGSMATGHQQDHSDIDVLVLEDADSIHKTRLYRNLAEVGVLLGREVNVIRYTPHELADRLGDPAHAAWGFVHEVLRGPKRWLVGTAGALAPIAQAAGIDRQALAGAAV